MIYDEISIGDGASVTMERVQHASFNIFDISILVVLAFLLGFTIYKIRKRRKPNGNKNVGIPTTGIGNGSIGGSSL